MTNLIVKDFLGPKSVSTTPDLSPNNTKERLQKYLLIKRRILNYSNACSNIV